VAVVVEEKADVCSSGEVEGNKSLYVRGWGESSVFPWSGTDGEGCPPSALSQVEEGTFGGVDAEDAQGFSLETSAVRGHPTFGQRYQNQCE
jgi:hypothetical protein